MRVVDFELKGKFKYINVAFSSRHRKIARKTMYVFGKLFTPMATIYHAYCRNLTNGHDDKVYAD